MNEFALSMLSVKNACKKDSEMSSLDPEMQKAVNIMHSASLFVCLDLFSFSPSFDPLSSPLHIMHDSDGDQATTAGVATIAVTLPLLIVLASVAIFVYKRKQGQTS